MIDRVCKLFALAAKNSNTHEAAAALDAARRIMREHQINDAQVDEHMQRSDLTSCNGAGGLVSVWESQIASFVQNYIGTVCVIRTRTGRHSSLEWFGRATDIAWASSLFDALRRAVERECGVRGWSTVKGDGRSFAHGYVSGLWIKTRRADPEHQAITLAATRAKQYADARAGQAIPTAKTPTVRADPSAWRQGVNAGRNASIAVGELAAPRPKMITA